MKDIIIELHKVGLTAGFDLKSSHLNNEIVINSFLSR